MRFVVYGAGAIGGVIGARLFQHGHEVLLIARGAHAAAIAADGLRLDDPTGSAVLPVAVATAPGEAELRGDDVILLAVKSQHTLTALDALAATAPPGVAIVCAQNGVENERVALRRFEHVYAMVVQLPATHLEPGVVMAHSTPVTGILDLGRHPAGVDATAQEIAAALSASSLVSTPRPDIWRWKYAKLLANLGNAAPIVFGLGTRGEPIVERAREEGRAALAAAGIDWTGEKEFSARHGSFVTRHPVAGYEHVGGSSWQSVERGTGSVECDYLNGEISLIGRLHGVATPVNDLLARLAGEVARGQLAAGATSPDAFEELLGAAASRP
ncbi:MAG TPA: 2-dehydropantoate 2-reductase N-terminal domain-containing protein [Acidimicrobiales bacterium]|nr:2-dehydropantoate 2-reductase N-terminal domain-containing protein [Acidimicrobiales bacterium]